MMARDSYTRTTRFLLWVVSFVAAGDAPAWSSSASSSSSSSASSSSSSSTGLVVPQTLEERLRGGGASSLSGGARASRRRRRRLEEEGSNNLAVTYISFLSTLSEPHLNLSVSTLRGKGGFTGAIYCITDEPACVPASVVPVKVSLNGCRKAMGFKWFKTLILELVPARHSLVLYLDVDVYLGKPLESLFALASVRSFAAGVGPHHVLGVRQDAKKPGWHGGISLLRRRGRKTSSQHCLEAWRARFLTVVRNRDQQALSLAVAEGACDFGTMDSSEHGGAATVSWPTHESIVAGDYALFNHFTRSGRIKRGHKHGITPDDLATAARQLFDLDAQAAEQWWLKRDASCFKEAQKADDGEDPVVRYSLTTKVCDKLAGR
jgi:hypothetical protein